MFKTSLRNILLLTCFIFITQTYAAPTQYINVASASNISLVIKKIAKQYERETNNKIKVYSDASEKLYKNILNHAAIDIFIPANNQYADRLIQSNLADSKNIETIARGVLVLWAPNTNIQNADIKEFLHKYSKTLVMSNPDHAPFGFAAKEVLNKLNVWQNLQPNLIIADNAHDALITIIDGKADAGFVSKAQLIHLKEQSNVPNQKSVLIVPQNLYTPITQKVILLNQGSKNPAAKSFYDYLTSPSAQKILQQYDLAA
ncbi:molybdate ABC transporter substrate-binding protein [Legionella yabuuchiae]|uniref:molybdate ABC transporter substrate-binding protein n=1 Tax=Legionella yabuuchiae TaxID=376727 RepID=UPI001054AB43|nr:molybdate ABC transporter substrate-binding protein [Legionella yabuuchiae]